MSGPDAAGRRQLEALGELIRKQRQQAELTLRELAERTNVSNPYLSPDRARAPRAVGARAQGHRRRP